LFEESLIKKSGQWWKALLSFWAVILGGMALMYGIQHSDDPNHPFAGYLDFFGLLTSIFGFVFGCLSIRCKACGAKWVWLAVSSQNVGSWMFWLEGVSECPKCKEASSASGT
jgi:uncharacterized membrane protein YedE/YeeE